MSSNEGVKRYKPFPLHPFLVNGFKEQMGMTEEEVTQPSAVRKVFDLNAAQMLPPKPDSVVEQEILITQNNISVKITHIRPAGSENVVLPAILYMLVFVIRNTIENIYTVYYIYIDTIYCYHFITIVILDMVVDGYLEV